MRKKSLLGFALLLLLFGLVNATPDVNVVYPNGGETLWGRQNVDFNVSGPCNKPALNASLYYSSSPGDRNNLIETIDLLHGNYCTPPYSQESIWGNLKESPSGNNLPDNEERRKVWITSWKDGTFGGKLVYFGKRNTGSYGSTYYYQNLSGYIDISTGTVVQNNEVPISAFSQIPPVDGDGPWNEFTFQPFYKPTTLTPTVLIGSASASGGPWDVTAYHSFTEYDWNGTAFIVFPEANKIFDWFDWHYYASIYCCYHWYITVYANDCTPDGNCWTFPTTYLRPRAFNYGGNFWFFGMGRHYPKNYDFEQGTSTCSPWCPHDEVIGYRYLGYGLWTRDNTFVPDFNILTYDWTDKYNENPVIWNGNLYWLGKDKFSNPAAITWGGDKWYKVEDYNKGIFDALYHSPTYDTLPATNIEYQNQLYHIQWGQTAYSTWKRSDTMWNTQQERACSYSWHTGTAEKGTWYLDVNVSNGTQTAQDSSDENFTIDHNNFLQIISPETGDIFHPNQTMWVVFQVRDWNGAYIKLKRIEYRLDSNSDWITRDVNGTVVYVFFASAPAEIGNYTLSIRANVDGNTLSDSINYEVYANDLSIEWVKPIQVIEDVNLVAGKATAVRVKVVNEGLPREVRTKLTYNGQDYYNTTEIDDYKIIDFYPTPYATPGTYQISATVDDDNKILETNENNNTKTANVNVTQTYGFKVIYRPVELWDNDTFSTAVYQSDAYMKAIYPLPANEIDYRKDDTVYTRYATAEYAPYLGYVRTLQRLYEMEYLSFNGLKPYDRVVGIVTSGWLKNNYWMDWHGISNPVENRAVLSETTAGISLYDIPAHEIGHTFELCDETTVGGFCGRLWGCVGCPNPYPYGHNTNGLWVECKDNWCLLNNSNERINFPCFMQSPGSRMTWIGKDSYNHLLKKFSTPHTEREEVLLVSGTADKNHTIELHSWYLMSGYPSEVEPGPYSIQLLDSNSQVLDEFDFNVSFIAYPDPTADFNIAGFIFAIPYPSDTNKVVVKYAGETKAERSLSANAPTVTVTSPKAGVVWTDTNSITWDANDLDGDDLNYVVQYSDDNGITWNPLATDVIDTNYTWDINEVHPSDTYKVKVIATDGILIGDDNSDTFTVKNSDIIVSPFMWDFGVVTQGNIISKDFNIMNIGNSDLNIMDMNYSPDINISGISLPLILSPNESQTFTATIDALNLSGDYSEDINISSNDPNENPKRIFVNGYIQNVSPDVSIDINAPYEVNYPDSYLLSATVTTQNAPLRDANITIALPQGLSTEDSLTVYLDNLFESDSKDANWNIDVNAVGLFEIVLTISSTNAVDYNESVFVSVAMIRIDSISADKNSYNLNETVTFDSNITNYNPNVTYTNLDLNIVITNPLDNNTSLHEDINLLYAGSTQTVTIAWGENKTVGEHKVVEYLYDGGQLVHSNITNFTVNPPTAQWILGYGGTRAVGNDYNVTYSILPQPAKKLVGTDYNVIVGWNYYD